MSRPSKRPDSCGDVHLLSHPHLPRLTTPHHTHRPPGALSNACHACLPCRFPFFSSRPPGAQTTSPQSRVMFPSWASPCLVEWVDNPSPCHLLVFFPLPRMAGIGSEPGAPSNSQLPSSLEEAPNPAASLFWLSHPTCPTRPSRLVRKDRKEKNETQKKRRMTILRADLPIIHQKVQQGWRGT